MGRSSDAQSKSDDETNLLMVLRGIKGHDNLQADIGYLVAAHPKGDDSKAVCPQHIAQGVRDEDSAQLPLLGPEQGEDDWLLTAPDRVHQPDGEAGLQHCHGGGGDADGGGHQEDVPVAGEEGLAKIVFKPIFQ